MLWLHEIVTWSGRIGVSYLALGWHRKWHEDGHWPQHRTDNIGSGLAVFDDYTWRQTTCMRHTKSTQHNQSLMSFTSIVSLSNYIISISDTGQQLNHLGARAQVFVMRLITSSDYLSTSSCKSIISYKLLPSYAPRKMSHSPPHYPISIVLPTS